MNAGTLQFALGLQAGGFLSGLDKAKNGMTSLIGMIPGAGTAIAAGVAAAFATVGVAAAGTMEAINKAGGLNDLSSRTGESVTNLYSLGQAFEGAGLKSENVTTMLAKLRKAMSGATDEGMKTSEIFSQMGLSFDTVKNMQGPERITAIAKALGRLNKDNAAGLAAKLFGREASGDIQQIAGDVEGFQSVLEDSAKEAAVFERINQAADKLGDTFGRIKGKLGGGVRRHS